MTSEGDDRTPAERIAQVDAALAEFHRLIQVVTTALIQNGPGADVADVERNAKGENLAEPSKTLAQKDVAFSEVTKTHLEATAKVEELTKALTGKDETTTTELETTKKSLTDVTTERDTIKARKGYAVGKFGNDARDQDEQSDDTKKSTMTLWMENKMGITQPERTAS